MISYSPLIFVSIDLIETEESLSSQRFPLHLSIHSSLLSEFGFPVGPLRPHPFRLYREDGRPVAAVRRAGNASGSFSAKSTPSTHPCGLVAAAGAPSTCLAPGKVAGGFVDGLGKPRAGLACLSHWHTIQLGRRGIHSHYLLLFLHFWVSDTLQHLRWADALGGMQLSAHVLDTAHRSSVPVRASERAGSAEQGEQGVHRDSELGGAPPPPLPPPSLRHESRQAQWGTKRRFALQQSSAPGRESD